MTLKATAKEGCTVTGWTDAESTEITTGVTDGGYLWNESLPTTSTLTLTMGTSSITVQANFASAGHVVNVAAHRFATFYCGETLTLPTAETSVQLYTVASVGTAEVTLTMPIAVAPAETPLLVYNSGDEAKNVILLTGVGTPDEVSAANEFCGTATGVTFTAENMAERSYFVCNGKQFVPVKTAGTIGANRCWLEFGSLSTARALDIVFGDATGIDVVNGSNGANNDWYDLRGRKVQSPTQKGIYINNGKKVVIK